MKNLYRDRIPLRVRLFAWFSIGVQTAFPIAAVFPPAIAGTGSDSHFLRSPAPSVPQTLEYILAEGESTASVAKKYNMTEDELRRLNQFRTFARGFDNLHQGDKLDVPLVSLPEMHWDDSASSKEAHNNDAQAKKVVSYASQASDFLANGADINTAASIALGMTTSAAGGEIQQWFSRFGTARVQLDTDNNFSLKNSQLELLVPLYEQNDSFVFTQGSIHRTDDRTQSNLGFGYRWFAGDNWMLGTNTFLDYDLSRDHARLGLGGEYWRDFLKLGVNTYHRLTNWKNSSDLEDYEERPANGWDIQTQAWIPSLPQLGGKLTYEQYYGDEVALFGRDNRQQDPHAITIGVNYTPVPLLTFSAEQRQGKSRENDTHFGMEITYQPGMPWQQQINPDVVAALRSLTGNRHDLVERNNNIVLEYHRKEVIRLKTADQVTGYAGEQKSLNVSVTSKYGLERIDWSASPLIAAGGKIVQHGKDWTVVMPTYNSGTEGINNYTVSCVAVDNKGNRSEQSSTQVTVQASVVSAEKSTFTPASSVLPADGKSKQVLTLSILDLAGKRTDIPVSDIVLKSEGITEAKISELISRDSGIFEVTVYSGKTTETIRLTPVVRGINLRPATIRISKTMPDSEKSTLSANPVSIIADNVSFSTLELILKNSEGVVLSGQTDKLSFTTKKMKNKNDASNNITLSAISEIKNKEGHYIATVKGKVADKYTFYPEFNGGAIGELQIGIELLSNTISSKIAEHRILKNNQASDGKSKNIIEYKIKDSNENPVKGHLLNLTVDSDSVIFKSQLKSDSDGIIVAEFISPTSGKFTVTASNDNGSVKDKIEFTDTVKFTEIKVNGPQLTSMPIIEYPGTFPYSGFKGAIFNLKTNIASSDLEWRTTAEWLSLNDGKVTFLNEPSPVSRDVKIIAKSKSNGSEAVYNFKIHFWFKNSGEEQLNPTEAENFCVNNMGSSYYLPSKDEITSQWRGINGRLWDEWGDLSNYSGAGFKTGSNNGNNLYYVTSTKTSNGGSIKIDMATGTPYGTMGGNNVNDKNYVICQRKLF